MTGFSNPSGAESFRLIAGISGVSFHCLRYSELTNMAINGADVMEIAKFAGHSNINSALLYVHLGSEYLRKHQS